MLNLEVALRDFILDQLGSYADEDHYHDYASADHEHNTDSFEDQVEYHLAGFTVGSGCSTKRYFEEAVRTIIVDHLEQNEHPEAMIRSLLRTILNTARALPTDDVITILVTCQSALLNVKKDMPLTTELTTEEVG